MSFISNNAFIILTSSVYKVNTEFYISILTMKKFQNTATSSTNFLNYFFNLFCVRLLGPTSTADIWRLITRSAARFTSLMPLLFSQNCRSAARAISQLSTAAWRFRRANWACSTTRRASGACSATNCWSILPTACTTTRYTARGTTPSSWSQDARPVMRSVLLSRFFFFVVRTIL